MLAMAIGLALVCVQIHAQETQAEPTPVSPTPKQTTNTQASGSSQSGTQGSGQPVTTPRWCGDRWRIPMRARRSR